MISGRFLRLFHALENSVYQRLKILKCHLPTARSFNEYSFAAQYAIPVRHNVKMPLKLYNHNPVCEAIR